MKRISIITILTFLMFTGISYAQTSTPAADPTQQPTDTDTDKKVDFSSPQSPVRVPNNPSEDTLIKATRSGLIIRDALIPSADNKNDIDKAKGRRRGKEDSQIDTASIKSSKKSVPR